jgi:drug/metabolite transporter (DMT)-like permease
MTCTPHRGIELGLLGLLALLWGSSYLLIRVALATIPPVTLIAARVAIAALVLLAVLWRMRMPLPRDRPTWTGLLVQSLLNCVLPWTLLAWGQQHVDSGLAGVLNSTSPVFVFFITLLFTRHEPAGARQLAGTALGLSGVALVVGISALSGVGRELGAQLCILLAALLYAGAAIYGRRHSHLPALMTAVGSLIWATLWLVPASLLLDRPWALSPSAQSLAAAAGLAVFGTAAALLLYFRLLRTLGSMGVASQSYLRAGVSVLLGVLILGEQVSMMKGAGLLAIVLGVVAINHRRTA